MLEAYSENNVANSLALYLAGRLLAAGYIVYWHTVDAVQTPDGWYYQYSTNSATYLANATFQARYNAAKGLLTLKGKASPSNKVFPARPTTDGSVGGQDDAQVPYLTVEVAGQVEGRATGLGDEPAEWFRHLLIYGCARDEREQSRLRDLFAVWFRPRVPFTVLDHDAGTQAVVGDLEFQDVLADSAILGTAPEATRFELVCSATLRYAA